MKKMLSGSPMRQILKFSIPILFSRLLQQLYSLVDTMIVGRYLGVDALAAVGSTWALNYIIVDFCTGTCIGLGIPVSQEYGAGNESEMRKFFKNGMYFAIALATVMTISTTLLCDYFLEWSNISDKIHLDAFHYIIVIFAGLPFAILYNFYFGVLMALGDSRIPSIIMAISTVINLILDFVFVVGMKMGVAGAALATIVSELFAGIFCLWWLKKNYPMFRCNKEESQLSLSRMKYIISVSVPMGLQYAVVAIGAVIMQSSINALGEIEVAAYSAGVKIKGLLLCPINALGSALSTFVAQNFGAHNIERIKKGVCDTVIAGLIYAVVVAVTSVFFAKPAALLFMDAENIEVIEQTELFIRMIAVFMVELAVLFPVRYAVQGMGFGRYSIFSGAAEMLARLLMALFVVPLYGFMAVCVSEGLTFLGGILVIVPVYIVLIRKVRVRDVVKR